MKNIFVFIFICVCLSISAQPNRKPKMAAVFVPGYYVNKKNDTIRGQVQINPEDPTYFYKQFSFIVGRSKKPKLFLAGQTKAYGFEERNFVSLDNDGRRLFAERLTRGRLRFYEYQFNGRVNGQPGIESAYFIRDLYAEGDKADLKEPKKLPQKFYKKALKPYLQDQLMLWSELDKYTFDKHRIVQTINEFNQFYTSSAN